MPYIALLCPAAVSLAIYRKRIGNEQGIVDAVISYLAFVLFDNMLTMLSIVYLLGIYDSKMEFMEGFTFFIKYVAIELVFALIVPPLFDLFRKFIVIRFDDSKVSGKQKKNGK